MNRWQLALLAIFGLCGLVLSNPGQAAYENYALDRIGELGREQCDRAPADFGVVLAAPCRAAIEAFKPQIKPLLAATSKRENFYLFSLYRSDISIPAVKFQGRIESIGIANNFFTYKTP
jgi:hypothetical protein